MMDAVTRRLLTGTAANALDKAAILAVQILAIPVLSQHWGVAGYGFWLLLMTVPAYASLADFGVGTAAGIEAAKRVALQDFAGANAVLQSALAVMAATLFGLIAGGTVVWVLCYAAREWIAPVVIAIAYAGVIVLSSIPAMALQATHKYAASQVIVAVTVGLEGVVLIAVVGAGGKVLDALTALLLVRCLGFLSMAAMLRRSEPWFRLTMSAPSLAQLRAIATPSLAALALTASAVVMLQGMILTLGWVAGTVAVASFGAARLLSRIPLQITGLLSRASQPELTRAYLGTDRVVLNRLNRLNVGLSVALAPVTIAGLAIVGPASIAALSSGRLGASWQLFGLLGLSASLNAIWTAAATALIARNEQGLFAYWALAAGLVAVLVPVLSPSDPPMAAAAGMAVADGIVTIIVLTQLRPRGSAAFHPSEA